MKKTYLKWIFAAVLVLAALLTGLWFLNSRYLFACGKLIPRDSETLDLRGEEVTLQDYTELQQLLPRCRIVWDVPFQGSSYPSDTTTLRVETFSAEDLQQLELFPDLQTLDATACPEHDLLMDFGARHPGCQVVYQVTLGGEARAWDTQTLTLENVDLEELRQALPLLPRLSRVGFTGDLPAPEELMAFRAENPGLLVSWEVTFDGETYPSSCLDLDLSGTERSFGEVEALLTYLPLLESCDMTGCGLSDSDMIRLADRFYQTFFIWEMEMAGTRFSTDSIEIDISGRKIQDVSEVEALLPYFPRLERLYMSDCGVDNETMDSFNRRYEDIKIVWTVYLRGFGIRTDSWYFYPYKMDPYRFPYKDCFYDVELALLRYCTDMRSIDLGHMPSVSDISFVAYMPHLRYLILTETAVSDLSPLSNCKELVYFEATKTYYITDLSPLIECTNLENVNLGWSYNMYPDPLGEMPWLQHVWWCSTKNTYTLPCSTAEPYLTEALPDTVLFFDGAHPVDGGWRQLQTYYDMRDIMGMFYLR